MDEIALLFAFGFIAAAIGCYIAARKYNDRGVLLGVIGTILGAIGITVLIIIFPF